VSQEDIEGGFFQVPTRKELLDKIEGDAGSLEGEHESQWLDFKKEPHLRPGGKTEDSHKFELAKDVSAMANAGGGLIVWGFTEAKDPTEDSRFVGKLSPIPLGIVDEDQVRTVIREWVFPTRIAVNIRKKIVAGGEVWVLDIPPPLVAQLPFLVVKEWPKDGRKPVRGHFTVYQRSGTSNARVPAEEVYLWLQRGYQAGAANATALPLDDYPGAWGVVRESTAAYGSDERSMATPPSADEALDEELDNVGVQEGSAYYFIQFAPTAAGRLERFFGQKAADLQERLRAVPTIRPRGFSCFRRGAQVERTPTNGLRIGLRGRSSVCVAPSGLVTYVCCQDTLTWASEYNAPAGKLVISPLALVEFTLEAAVFFLLDVLSRGPDVFTAGKYTWRIGMDGLGGQVPVHLPRGQLRGVPLSMTWDTDAPETSKDFVTDFRTSTVDEGPTTAFMILDELYYQFGYPSDAIPYIKNEAVDVERIRPI